MAFWRISNFIVDKTINGVIGQVFKEKKLPLSKDFLIRPCDLVLTVVSKALMSNRGRMDDVFKFTGFLRWQAPESQEQETRITTFSEGERVPVLSFGSVTFDDTHSIISRFEKNWPRGKKIVVQTGWSGLSVEVERPEILVVGKMSHDQLFRHASCVVHHGGAGTTASVLTAGKPHIIIPHIADQHFFGAEMKRLEVGVVIKQKHWPEQLPSRVQLIEEQQSYSQKAVEIQKVLQEEDGPVNAVKALETFVTDFRSH